MKILYLQTFPLSGSGSGTYARELAKEVAKRHEVAMVVPDTKRKIQGVRIFPAILGTKLAFTGHPEWPDCKLFAKVEASFLLSYYISFFKAIVEAVNEFKPDIIHVHHLFPLTWIARYIKMAYGINFITTAHGSEIPTMEEDKRYINITIEALKKSSRIVPNSFWTREWMKKVLGESFLRQTRVIPGGVDLVNFPPSLNTADVNSKYHLSSNDKLVLFSGKLTKYKGVKYLVQASKKIKAKVGIVGDGPERRNLENLTKELNITNIIFLGHKETKDLIKLYYRADVAVFPSVWDEPLGLVVLEAMAAKTPVVVTKKGGIPLLVKDGFNGFFINPRNSSDIADKVNNLLGSEKLRKKMGERARKLIIKKFTWEEIAMKFEKMYEEFRKRERKEALTPIEIYIKKLFTV